MPFKVIHHLFYSPPNSAEIMPDWLGKSMPLQGEVLQDEDEDDRLEREWLGGKLHPQANSNECG